MVYIYLCIYLFTKHEVKTENQSRSPQQSQDIINIANMTPQHKHVQKH